MEHKVEELSPVSRKISITVPVEEVNAALSAAVALYRHRYEIKGFRRGKAPASVVESKYRAQLYTEATTDLINYQINEVLSTLNMMPLSRIDMDGKELVRDEEFNYTISFEVAPDFALPDYEGLAVEVEKAEPGRAAGILRGGCVDPAEDPPSFDGTRVPAEEVVVTPGTAGGPWKATFLVAGPATHFR